MSTPPASPPAAPVIPAGLATRLGAIGTLTLGVVALVTAVINGDHTSETVTALAGAVATLVATIYGRMQQAAAIYRSDPTPTGMLGAYDAMRAPVGPGDPLDPPPLARP